MKYLGTILEEFGVKNLPISSYLNWSDLEFDKVRKKKSDIYKKYGGKEVADERRSKKKKIKADIDKIKNKGNPGIYFIFDKTVTMQYFSLDLFNIRFRNPLLDIFKKWDIDVLASKTYFSLEDRLNRIHFLKGIDPQLRGTGLAEIIYREIIHYIGWATSNADAKPGVKIIWSNLAKDDDFYTIVTYFDVLAISKRKGYTEEEIRAIVYRFLESKVENIYKYKGKTEIDPELLEMFPELKDKYYKKGKVIKRFEKILTRDLDHLPFINDSLLIRNETTEELCLIRDAYFIDGKIIYWCVIREGHLLVSPYIEKGEIGFSLVDWDESTGEGKYTILETDVDVVGIIPDKRDIRLTRRNVTAQDLIDGYRITYVPRKVVYNGEKLYQLVFSKTRVRNALEVRISYPDSPISVYGKRLQLIKNHEYYKRIFIAR